MIERQILKVLYSPFKAFEEISENPSIRGPLLILTLAVITTGVAGYISSSKIFLQVESGGEYVPLIATEMIGGQIVSIVIDAVFRFSLSWLLYAGAILVVIKVFREKEGPWRLLFIVIGYTLIVAAIYAIIWALLISTLPTVQLRWELWSPQAPPMEETLRNQMWENAFRERLSSMAYKVGLYLSYIVEGWTAALGAIAVHFLRDIIWRKAIVISATASALSFLLRIPLLM